MGDRILHPRRGGLGALVKRQHGVVTMRQLLELGFSRKAVKHRIKSGRLHPAWPGVYAVGRPQLSLYARWMAAVLACGPGAVLSHESAAALWEIRAVGRDRVDVSIPRHMVRAPRRISVHRRACLGANEVALLRGIPVTSPIGTLVDIAATLAPRQLEAAVNEADKRDLVNPDTLRSTLAELPRRPGIRALRELLDSRTFTLTDSELERRLLPLIREAGLPRPRTGSHVNGFKVDFHWPDLGLVVETDGLRYHRTPGQQARDRVRDQAHAAAGLTPLRFTRAQVSFEPDHVRATLSAVAHRLRAARSGVGPGPVDEGSGTP